VQDKGSSLLRVRDHFVHGNIKFIQESIQQKDRVKSESNKKGQSELKEVVHKSQKQENFQDKRLNLNQDQVG
jgi:hypothetical protein